MLIRSIGLLALGLFLAAGTQPNPAWAQGTRVEHDGKNNRPTGAVGAEYASQCSQNGLRCTLVYGDAAQTSDATASAASTSSRQLLNPPEPIITGPLAIVVVLVVLATSIGLWMRFGNGGMLLSQAPREMKRREGEVPESWRSTPHEIEERPNDFLQRIAAMQDRRQALVLLLRHCLLHAADATGTRLFRYDTERAVLSRLPVNMAARDRLENLLIEAELVHYGGRALVESQFTDLLATARGFLSNVRVANA